MAEVEATAYAPGIMPGPQEDLVDLIRGLGVLLRKVGQQYMGLCPFHEDHQESLAVYRDQNRWKCFSTGCGKGGSAKRFIREWTRLPQLAAGQQ